MTGIQWCEEWRACEEALDWIRAEHPDATLAELWDVCPRADWMIWALGRAQLFVEHWPEIDPWLDDIVALAVKAAEADAAAEAAAAQVAEAVPWAAWAGVMSEAARAAEAASAAEWAAEAAEAAGLGYEAEHQRQANALRRALGNPFEEKQ